MPDIDIQKELASKEYKHEFNRIVSNETKHDQLLAILFYECKSRSGIGKKKFYS